MFSIYTCKMCLLYIASSFAGKISSDHIASSVAEKYEGSSYVPPVSFCLIEGHCFEICLKQRKYIKLKLWKDELCGHKLTKL